MDKDNQPKLAETIVIAGSALEAFANKYVFSQMNVSSSSMKILLVLSTNKPMTSSDIIRLTGASKSNLSQRITVLEKNNYVIKVQPKSSSDKRNSLIKITTEGRAKLREVKKRFAKNDISLEKHFTAKELTTLYSFFTKIHTLIENEEERMDKIIKKDK